METVYAREPFPSRGSSSIFLAGPTPRSAEVPSWRPQALAFLAEKGYAGHVYIPEPRTGNWSAHYDEQVLWEEAALHRADAILFWVPRDTETLPGLTTNDEWGYWKDSGKVVFGAPPEAPSVRYQRHYASAYGAPQATTLSSAVEATLSLLTRLGAPQERIGAELEVPAAVWRTSTFQNWYANLKAAGNRLDGARVEWAHWVGPNRDFLFLWALRARVWIGSEGRHKTNEVLLGRPDISTVVAHGPVDRADIGATEIVLVREFRAPVNNPTGYVWEPPGGSSFKPGRDPRTVAVEEIYEETGVLFDPEAIIAAEPRQVASTLSAHRAHLYSLPLTRDQLSQFRAEAGKTHGVVEDTERTYVEVLPLRDLMRKPGVDWSAAGQILAAVCRAAGVL